MKVHLRYHKEREKVCPQFYDNSGPITFPLNGLEGCLITILSKMGGLPRGNDFDYIDGDLELGEVELPGFSEDEIKRYRSCIELAFNVYNELNGLRKASDPSKK